MPASPLLLVSMGDPAGIGPEVIVKALRDMKDLPGTCRIAVVGDVPVMEQAVRVCKSRLKIQAVRELPSAAWDGKTLAVVNPFPRPLAIRCGEWSKASGESSYLAVKHAVERVYRKEADAVVTAPICKEAWRAAGVRFAGHTEMIAKFTHATEYAMMFVNGPFRLVLVTIHVALAKVPRLITRERIIQTAGIGAAELRRHFGIAKPRVAIAGLNPHAGESGLFGREEIQTINPAVRALEKKPGLSVYGPFPPDTLFAEAARGTFDLVVCMYHDQGLIPFKMLALHQGVNLTAGLPIIRTSPDHGTAFELAGTGRADAGSMAAAIRTALAMARQERKVGR